MFPALSPMARRTAALIAIAALTSVVMQFFYLNGIRTETYGETAWSMARFFTILTNITVCMTFAVAAMRRDGVSAPWLAALTLAIVMVGGVYHALLSHLTDYRGVGLLADHGLHTVVPIACLLWWAAFAPKRPLVFADLPMFALWPSVYVAYALGRGAVDGEYPYPFMDLTELAPDVVAVNLGGLTLSLLVGGAVMVTIGRLMDR